MAVAFNALSTPNSATWVLEADIQGCYDNIAQEWMLSNIPLDACVLRKWLRAGYVENGITYPLRKGTLHGGVNSPSMANMTLDGLEEAVHTAVPPRSRVIFVRYAEDFIITGKSKRLLEESIRPAVEALLAERGLTLSKEKTAITYIKNGFTFLEHLFRKHGRVLHITAARQGVLALVRKVGTLIRKHISAPLPVLIKKLNEALLGWANYHRHVVASEAFCRIDSHVFEQLWRMLRPRYPKKSKGWLIRRYWSATGRQNVFSVRGKTARGQGKVYQAYRVGSLGIRNIRAEANPYLPEYAGYFWRRRQDKASKLQAALSARELRAMAAVWGVTYPGRPTRAAFGDA